MRKHRIGKRIMLFCSVAMLCWIYITADSQKISLANLEYKNDRLTSSDLYFSRPSGFYPGEFALEIIAPTSEIYYTVDGSVPDKTSIRYQEPIHIIDATANPNIYSERTDVTAGFLEDLRLQYSSLNTRYSVPKTLVDKCTIIRAVYYKEDGSCSDVLTGSYFVGFDQKSGYQDINVISIVTEPKYLFGEEEGIYVLGNYFSDFLESGLLDDETYGRRTVWWWWPANYRQPGRQWERPATVQFFNNEKELVLTQDAGIRIQGGGSRGYLPKSLNLYARKEYSGNQRFHYDFFDTGYRPKRVTLTSGGDDFFTKMKDPMISDLASELDIVTMHYQPYALFLDGEYWGFYFLTEKYDEKFLNTYYQVTEENILMIKNGEVEIGEEEDLALYQQTMQFLETADMSVDFNYEQACTLVDMESLIDYFAVETYIARSGDWPVSNFALWRSKDIGNGEYEDGKWRYMLFDLNSGGVSEEYVEIDSIAYVKSASPVFRNLCNQPKFQVQFSEKLMKLGETIFSPESVNKEMDTWIRLMEEPMALHYQRFFCESNKEFRKETETIRNFFVHRYNYIQKSIIENFPDNNLDDF